MNVPVTGALSAKSPGAKVMRKGTAIMMGMAQRDQPSRSVVARAHPSPTTPYKQTLFMRDDLSQVSGARYHTQGRQSLNKSVSGNSLGNVDERMQRSQVNIDKKMREDFDRLQVQLKKREEKEKQAQELAKFNLEEKVLKANTFN